MKIPVTKKDAFKVYVVKYWLSTGVFESNAELGYISDPSGVTYIHLLNEKGDREGWDSLRLGTDAVLTKSEAEELVHSLAAKKVRSLDNQREKVLKRAKNPWRKK